MTKPFPQIRRIVLLLGITFAMLSALCVTAPAQDQIAPLKVNVGGKAPNFALKDGEGKTVKLSDFKGHPVLIDFFRGYW